MSIIKYFLLLVLTFVLTFSITCFIYFEDIKSDTIDRFVKQSDNISLYLKEILKKASIDNDFKTIDSSLNTLLNIEVFDNVELIYKNYFFSKKAILTNSKKITDERYLLSDVTTDYKNGKINILKDDIYVFIPDEKFDFKTPLAVKFQALNHGEVYNSTSYLNFYMSMGTKNETNDKSLSFIDSFIDSKELYTKRDILINFDDKPFVQLKYSFNKLYFIEQIKLYLEKIFIYSISLFLVTIIILYIFYYKVIKKEIGAPIQKVGSYIDDILENKYVKLEQTDSKLLNIDKIYLKLQVLSKKFASVTNELNINKDILERKELIDDLTGLPNKKVFEKDMKTMFVTNKTGFIILCKINKLGEFTTKHGSNDANHLIEDFGHHMLSILKKYNKIKSSIYRFYGAEFAMIVQTRQIDELKTILSHIVKSLDDNIKGKYLIDDQIAYFGATAFDNYGTIDSILHSAHESYMEALKDPKISFYISDNAELVQKTKQNEQIVKDIIQRADFAVKFIFDTFDMDDEKKLIMQDASPLILDSETFEKFPIGTFISVAEKLNLSSTFDKIMVEKVLEYLKSEQVEHKIAINLSIKSFTDRTFLSWLEGTLLYNEYAQNNLIFSITSYNAKANLAQFKSLVELLHKFNSKIILKRFSFEDFSIDELDDFKLDYIRLSKEYCFDINKDRLKKHSVKNIILYGQMNNVYILGDTIKSEDDYKTMHRLGLDGTSR